MPQRQILQSGLGDLLPGDRVIVAALLRGVPVEHHQVHKTVVLRPEAFQQTFTVGLQKGRAVDTAAQRLAGHGGNGSRFENMYVIRPGFRQVGAARAQTVVVSGRDKDLRAAGVQGIAQSVHRIPVDLPGVEQISRQQQKLAALLPAGLTQALQQASLLRPARRRLICRQTGKGAVQMQIRPVHQFNHGSSPFLPRCKVPWPYPV